MPPSKAVNVMSAPVPGGRWPSLLPVLSMALLALAYVTGIYLNARNFPLHDDYHDSLQFILAYQDAGGFRELLSLFLSQHMEHRQVLNHVLFAAYYELMGELNYRHLLAIANINLVLIFLLYAREFTDPGLRLLGALLMFSPSFWNASFWLVAAASNFAVILFALATFALLANASVTRLCLAAIMGLASVLSFGNGLAALPAGAIILYLTIADSTRRWRLLALWLAWTALVCTAYFIGYEEPQIIQDMFYRHGKEDAWQLALSQPLQFVVWILAVIGSGFSFGHQGAGSVVGLAMVTGFLYLLCTRSLRHRPVATVYAAFLLGTLTLAAWKRFVLINNDVALPNRYALYSVVLGCFLFAMLAEHWRNRRGRPLTSLFTALVLAGAVVFNAYGWHWGLDRAERMYGPAYLNLTKWLHRGEEASLFVMFADEPEPTLRTAMARGVYTPLSAIPPERLFMELPDTGPCPDDTRGRALVLAPPDGALLHRLDRKALRSKPGDSLLLCGAENAFRLDIASLPVYVLVDALPAGIYQLLPADVGQELQNAAE